MRILVTGAAGFLGTRLIKAWLDGPAGVPRVTHLIAADTAACPIADPRVASRTGSVADHDFVASLFTEPFDLVYHLAAVLSGQAESDLDLGMAVNVDGTRRLLEACRRLASPPRFVFSSTTAVYGGRLPALVDDDTAITPQSSYGTEKRIAELLVLDYSRRGLVDGIVCRVPTVAIRPGAPNSALSSFVSGIVREPLAGLESVCPVPLDTRLWISSPDAVTANLVNAARASTTALDGSRAVNLPGVTVTPSIMLDSLERLGGAAARARVRCAIDERTAGIVGGWPGAVDGRRALRAGFVQDANIDAVVRQFMGI
jgi:nucleoside-diphosphate-sugar epimerase